jgi:ectoine hydroxylase
MPTGPAGSVVVFDCNAMHGSYDNLSADHRINLFVVYNAQSNALEAPFAAPRPRPNFIAARDCTPLPT